MRLRSALGLERRAAAAAAARAVEARGHALGGRRARELLERAAQRLGLAVRMRRRLQLVGAAAARRRRRALGQGLQRVLGPFGLHGEADGPQEADVQAGLGRGGRAVLEEGRRLEGLLVVGRGQREDLAAVFELVVGRGHVAAGVGQELGRGAQGALHVAQLLGRRGLEVHLRDGLQGPSERLHILLGGTELPRRQEALRPLVLSALYLPVTGLSGLHALHQALLLLAFLHWGHQMSLKGKENTKQVCLRFVSARLSPSSARPGPTHCLPDTA